MVVIIVVMVKELCECIGFGMMECKKVLVEVDGSVDVVIEELCKFLGLKVVKKVGCIVVEGVLLIKIFDDNIVVFILEVNFEIDFVVCDDNFMMFVNYVLDVVFEQGEIDVVKLMEGDLEVKCEVLVQKIGENIIVCCIVKVEGLVVGGYVYSNNKIVFVVVLIVGDVEVVCDIVMYVVVVNLWVGKLEDMLVEEFEKEKDVIKVQLDMEGKFVEIVEKMMGGWIKKFFKENSFVEQLFVKNLDQIVGELIKVNGGELVGFVCLEVGEGIEKEEVDFVVEVVVVVGISKV